MIKRKGRLADSLESVTGGRFFAKSRCTDNEMPSCGTRRLIRPLLPTVVLWLAFVAAFCQPGRPAEPSLHIVPPAAVGLDVPPGPISPGGGARVATHDQDGQAVVGRLHVRVGKQCIVLMPDGQLVTRPHDELSYTDRKFVPLSREELATRLAVEFPGFKVGTTRHYVYVHSASDTFAKASTRILESMIPGMLAHAKSQQIDVAAPEVPLVAVMFRTAEQFHAHRRMPKGVLAYYHTLSNRIVMHEESAIARKDLALQQVIATVAHEGAHQILHNIGAQSRLSVWPMWLSEGLAEYYAPTSFAKRMRWKGAGQVNDLRMFELELYLRSREDGPADGKIVEETLKAGRLTSTGYASAWALTHYLATKRRADFHEYVRTVSRLGPLEALGESQGGGVILANIEHFAAQFGDDLGAVEQKLAAHLSKLPYKDPSANWPYFVATISIPGSLRNANLFHSRQLAKKWIEGRRTATDASHRSALRTNIRSFPNRGLAERYVREWLAGR